MTVEAKETTTLSNYPVVKLRPCGISKPSIYKDVSSLSNYNNSKGELVQPEEDSSIKDKWLASLDKKPLSSLVFYKYVNKEGKFEGKPGWKLSNAMDIMEYTYHNFETSSRSSISIEGKVNKDLDSLSERIERDEPFKTEVTLAYLVQNSEGVIHKESILLELELGIYDDEPTTEEEAKSKAEHYAKF